MLAPASLGGGEVSPEEMIQALSALGAADGSAGWCTMVAATSGLALARLDHEAAAEIFSNPQTMIGGVFAPRGRAVCHDRNWKISGRWPFGSNIAWSDWMLGGCMVEGEKGPRLVFLPREEVELIDTWHVSGLRGTGSHDFSVEGLNVPASRAADPAAAAVEPGPLYVFPMFATLALGIAAVSVGIATAAIDEFAELATKKTPTASKRPLAEREVVQAAVARARGEVEAGRALILDQARTGWVEAGETGELSLERRAGLRLAASHAVSASQRAALEVFQHAGASASYESSPLQRRVRDLQMAGQHLMVAPPTFELAGRVELGLDVEGRGL